MMIKVFIQNEAGSDQKHLHNEKTLDSDKAQRMIRPYKATDLSELLEAWYSASLLGHPFLDEAFFQQERSRIREVYLPNAETWVFEQDGAVVGFIALIGNEVGALFVDSNYRGTGIGRALMDHARSIRDFLELAVFRDNKVGREFYEKCGFHQIDEHVHEETGLMQLRLRLTC